MNLALLTCNPQVDCSTLSFVRDKVPVFCEKRTEVFNGEYVTTRGCSVDYRWEDVQGYRDISGEEVVMMFIIHFVCSRVVITPFHAARGPGALHQEVRQGDVPVQQRQVQRGRVLEPGRGSPPRPSLHPPALIITTTI